MVEVRTGRHAALFSLGRLDEADDEYRSIERAVPDRVGPGRRDGGAGAQPQPPDAFRRGDRARPGVAARVRHRRARRATGSPPSSTTFGRPAPVAGQHRPGRRSGSARAQRPRAAGREPPDRRGPAAWRYFVADTRDDRLAGHRSAAHLDRARPEPVSWSGRSPTPPTTRGRSATTTRPRTGRCGGSWRSARPAGTSPARRRRGTWPPPSPAGSSRSRHGVRAAHRARDGLIAGGRARLRRLHLSSCPCRTRWTARRRSASFVAEIDDGFAFLRRTGNEQTGRWLDSYEWLAGVLRSEGSAAASEAVPLERYADDPTALIYAHLCRAIAAAIFGDSAGLAEHSAGGDGTARGRRTASTPSAQIRAAARLGPCRGGPCGGR